MANNRWLKFALLISSFIEHLLRHFLRIQKSFFLIFSFLFLYWGNVFCLTNYILTLIPHARNATASNFVPIYTSLCRLIIRMHTYWCTRVFVWVVLISKALPSCDLYPKTAFIWSPHQQDQFSALCHIPLHSLHTFPVVIFINASAAGFTERLLRRQQLMKNTDQCRWST